MWTALCNAFMDFYDRRQLAVCPTEFEKIEHYYTSGEETKTYFFVVRR